MANSSTPYKARSAVALRRRWLSQAIAAAAVALDVAGERIEVDLTETDPKKAKAAVEKMCKELLANTVIENYSYELG